MESNVTAHLLRQPVLGVLGGLGPAATADFLTRIIANTPASRDQDHIATIVYSDPSTPDRSNAINNGGLSPLPALLRGIEFLASVGVTGVAIPCNTAHFWHNELQGAVSIPVLDMVQAVADRVKSDLPSAKRIGLMSTAATADAGIYDALGKEGCEIIHLNDLDTFNPVVRGINEVKAGNLAVARDLFFEGANLLAARGAEGLIYGCTEISVVIDPAEVEIPLPAWDSSEELALTAVNFIQTRQERVKS